MLLGLVTPATAAGWIFYGNSEQADFFVDDRFLAKQPTYPQSVWALTNYFEPQKNGRDKPYRSELAAYEIDCDAQGERLLGSYRYAGEFSRGGVVSRRQEPEATPHNVVPGSVGEMRLRLVCERKVPSVPDETKVLQEANLTILQGRRFDWMPVDKSAKNHEYISPLGVIEGHTYAWVGASVAPVRMPGPNGSVLAGFEVMLLEIDCTAKTVKPRISYSFKTIDDTQAPIRISLDTGPAFEPPQDSLAEATMHSVCSRT